MALYAMLPVVYLIQLLIINNNNDDDWKHNSKRTNKYLL